LLSGLKPRGREANDSHVNYGENRLNLIVVILIFNIGAITCLYKGLNHAPAAAVYDI
jgi:hypothetical protein